MKDYIQREIKIIIYIIIIFVIVLVIVPLITGEKPDYNFNEIIRDQRMLLFLALILAYVLIYPFIAYVSIKRHLNGSFSDNRPVFEKAFETLQYIKIKETPEKVIYRKKSKFTRFALRYEDRVVVIPTENPVTISGLRKSVSRIDKLIDQMLMKK